MYLKKYNSPIYSNSMFEILSPIKHRICTYVKYIYNLVCSVKSGAYWLGSSAFQFRGLGVLMCRM